MEIINKQESPIIRLTRWQVDISLPNKKSSKEPPKDENWTIYGADTEGNERVYAQVPSEQFEKWPKSDRLWSQAQSALFDRLLSNPRTRDTVIKINIQAALKKDEEDTAIKLWKALSESAKAELIAKTEA
jgi:hypothetical protein